VHFNAFEQREGPVGTEVWYISQKNLAAQLSAAMADGGDFIDRGAKYTDDLKFLNSTNKPAVLLEVCFVDSEEDCRLYEMNFTTIIEALADVFAEGEEEITEPVPPPGEEIIPPRVDISVSGDVLIYVNGDQVGTKG
jgi:N-acetylmuramoyl-L-alanine amidase